MNRLISIKQFFFRKIENPTKQTFWNTLSVAVPAMFSVCTMPVFTRVLGTDGFGIWSVYLAWLSFFAIFCGLGIDAAASVPQFDFTLQQRKKYYSTTAFIPLGFSSVIILLIIALNNKVESLFEMPFWMVLLVVLAGVGLFLLNYMVNITVYEKLPHISALLQIAVSLFSYGLSLILVLLPFTKKYEYESRIIGYSMPYLALIVLTVFFALLYFGKPDFKQYTRYCLKASLPLLFSGLSVVVLSQSDRVMLQKLVLENAESSVGIYSAAASFTGAFSMIWGALNKTWVTEFCGDYVQKDYKRLQKKQSNYCFLFSCLVIGYILVSPEIFVIFAGKNYSEGKSLLPIFAVNIFLNFVSTFPVNYLVMKKQTKYLGFIGVLVCGVNIGMNYLLIPRYGFVGAAVASGISYGLQSLLCWVFAYKNKDKDYVLKGKVVAVSIAVISLCLIFEYLLMDSWLPRYVLASIVGVIIVVYFYKTKNII